MMGYCEKIIHKEITQDFKEKVKPFCDYFFIVKYGVNTNKAKYRLNKVCVAESIKRSKTLEEIYKRNEDILKKQFENRLKNM